MARFGNRFTTSDLPLDLQLALAWAAALVVTHYVDGIVGVALGIVVGVPFVLFVPGYAVVGALFPEASDGEDGSIDTRFSEISTSERLVLSIAVSLVVILLFGTVLAVTPIGFRPASVAAAIGSFTVAVTVFAAYRRLSLPLDERFVVPAEGVRDAIPSPDSAAELSVNVILVVCLLLAAGAVAHTVTSHEREGFTEVSLLSETESGTLVADEFPSELVRGQQTRLRFALENHEGRTVEYTVLVRFQQGQLTDDGLVTAREQRVALFSPSVGPGVRWTVAHSVRPRLSGERLRLQYLVYRGEPPSNPTAANAYRDVHLWVNISG